MTTRPRPAPAWPKAPLIRRLNDCATMLSLHGALTDAERRAVHKRLMKLKAKQAKP